jgi:DNA-binding beta-propeller fold protein YncE
MKRIGAQRLGLSLALALSLVAATPAAWAAPAMPQFQPELDWLKMPAGMALGEISAVAVDRHDTVWVLQRPRTVPMADRAHAAPPILAFDRDGHFLRGFGGPGAGYDWPAVEHSLAVDGDGRVWISGNSRAAPADDVLLTFSNDGHFLRQIGRPGASGGDADTANLHAAADIFVDNRTREVYVADGYGNRRAIVFDSDTGRFKRMWSAFGAVPPPDPAPDLRPVGAPFTPATGEGPTGFNGVHGIELSRDGLVYVSDRNNQRIQIFDRRGKYRRQFFVDRNMASPQTASGIAFSPDSRQRYIYVADWGNSNLLVFERATLKQLGKIGAKGAAAGQFIGPHLIATDSRGNLYVAEVQGKRLQRLVIKQNL